MTMQVGNPELDRTYSVAVVPVIGDIECICTICRAMSECLSTSSRLRILKTVSELSASSISVAGLMPAGRVRVRELWGR